MKPFVLGVLLTLSAASLHAQQYLADLGIDLAAIDRKAIKVARLNEIDDNATKFAGNVIRVRFSGRAKGIDPMEPGWFGALIDFIDVRDGYASVLARFPKEGLKTIERVSMADQAKRSVSMLAYMNNSGRLYIIGSELTVSPTGQVSVKW